MNALDRDEAMDMFDMFRNPNVPDGRKKYEAEMRLRWPPGKPPVTSLSFGLVVAPHVDDTTIGRIKRAVEATRDTKGPPPEAFVTPAMAREHVANCKTCQALEK